MNLPIIKVTKYDLLMNNIPVTFASDECLVMLEDTGDIFHWKPNKYLDMYANAHIDRYTKLINQLVPATQNIGYTVDINGRIERPYENIGYSDRTTTSSYKYIGYGGSTCGYSSSKASPVYLSDGLIVNDKHTLCLACGRFIHTPKIGKYNDRYCDNCGCYMPEIMFGRDNFERQDNFS